jgi:hypothetical protein
MQLGEMAMMPMWQLQRALNEQKARLISWWTMQMQMKKMIHSVRQIESLTSMTTMRPSCYCHYYCCSNDHLQCELAQIATAAGLILQNPSCAAMLSNAQSHHEKMISENKRSVEFIDIDTNLVNTTFESTPWLLEVTYSLTMMIAVDLIAVGVQM